METTTDTPRNLHVVDKEMKTGDTRTSSSSTIKAANQNRSSVTKLLINLQLLLLLLILSNS